MKNRPVRMIPVLALALATLLAIGCGDDGPTEPTPPKATVLRVVVASATDSTLLQNSNVVLYQADTREAVLRGLTNAKGTVLFEQPAGDYFVNVSSQGFDSTPPENITPIPFFVAAEETTTHFVALDAHDGTNAAGFVYGSLEPAMSNFLITAQSLTTSQKYYTATGPDGVFLLYNLPYDDYAIEALKAGWATTSDVAATLGAAADVDSVVVSVAEYAGSSLSGAVTFLASENSVVDITLLDPETRAVVPGLSVMSNAANLTYAISSIPDGSYLAWASFKNDGYVIDPDWLFKNPGGLDIAFLTSGTEQLSFSVTDAIPLVSPTNPASSTLPEVAGSIVPTFRWVAYPSTKEYFIEVRDLNGRLLWGGFDKDGKSNHAFIGPSTLSVAYNFDAQPGVPPLEPGRIYQWRLWADKGTQSPGVVEQLISASEDLRGLFRVPTEEEAL